MLRQFLGNPEFEYCASEYGAIFTKRTGLWGIFNHPAKDPLFKNHEAQSLGGNQFKKFGSDFAMSGDGGGKAICPPKFAKSFFEANP